MELNHVLRQQCRRLIGEASSLDGILTETRSLSADLAAMAEQELAFLLKELETLADRVQAEVQERRQRGKVAMGATEQPNSVEV